eukprot:416213_1
MSMLLLLCYLILCHDTFGFEIPSDIAVRIDNDEIIFASDNPKDGFYPNIGNGFIGRNVGCYKHTSTSTINNVDTQIGQTPCGSLYMSGIYNGYLNPSIHANSGEPHRARIPGIHSYYIQSNTKNDNYNIKWIGTYIDLINGTVNNRSQIYHPTKCNNNGQPIEVEIISYTHRHLRSLMILNISIVNTYNLSSNLSCIIPLLHCNSNYTNDIKWNESITNNNGYNIILRNMQTLVNVTMNTTTFGIGVAYQPINNNINNLKMKTNPNHPPPINNNNLNKSKMKSQPINNINKLKTKPRSNNSSPQIQPINQNNINNINKLTN